jgi:HAD superfamily hydrolase (TIGR01509 family)
VLKNILWDVDGTLFDTYPAITYAISKSLNEMGLSIALNVIDSLARQSINGCIATLSKRFKLDPDLLGRRFAESYQMVNPGNQPPYPGVYEVCELTHTRSGVNVIVTHRGVQSTQRLLDTHGLSPFFSDIFSVEQGHPRKPNPAMLLAALEKYALEPDVTLAVGDRDMDIQAGQSAGVHTCLFEQSESTTKPDFQIKSYAQLLKILLPENLPT